MSTAQKTTRPTLLGTSKTTPVDQRKRKDVQVRVRKQVAIFYVGGAGDKRKYVPLPAFIAGPFRNILDAKKLLDNRTVALRRQGLIIDFWRGYYELYGDENLKKHVFAYIPKKTTPVIIIGHSLGAWNGAHLSSLLTQKGYSVEMLVTLDPVGEGEIVSSTSNIYPSTPKPKSKYWINILANPSDDNFSDFIADFGEQWKIDSGPQVNEVVNINHADAGIMFRQPLSDSRSALDIVYKRILELTK